MGSSGITVNAELIRQARLRKFLTQDEVGQLCAELGHRIDRANLSRIERGLMQPGLKKLPVLAEVLGLDIDKLLAA